MIGVVDYGLGNIGSILNALEKLGVKAIKTNKERDILLSDMLIFPGDGAAGRGMENLRKMNLISTIKKFIQSGKPFLGICLGMQILMSFSEEGNSECLGIIEGKAIKFKNGLKIPHIGWNQIKNQKSKIKNQKYKSKIKNLLKDIPDKSYFYFINSYYCIPDDESIITATSNYGADFCSMFIKENITGVQFHPEKSGEVGLKLLSNIIGSIE